MHPLAATPQGHGFASNCHDHLRSIANLEEVLGGTSAGVGLVGRVEWVLNPNSCAKDDVPTWGKFATGSAYVDSWPEEAKTAHGYMLTQHAVVTPYLGPTHGAPNQHLDRSGDHSHSAPEGMHEESGGHL